MANKEYKIILTIPQVVIEKMKARKIPKSKYCECYEAWIDLCLPEDDYPRLEDEVFDNWLMQNAEAFDGKSC